VKDVLFGSASWEITHRCGYRCPYCPFVRSGGADRAEREEEAQAPSRRDWEAFWKMAHRRYGPFLIELSGGEPSGHPGFFPMLAELSRLHRFKVLTNLSWEPAGADGVLDPECVDFLASFHPGSVELGAFIAKLARLRGMGFRIVATVVAYPPHLPDLPEYQRVLQAAGVEHRFEFFQGLHEGRSYPEAYETDDKQWLRRSRGQHSAAFGFSTGAMSPKGRLCAAGTRYFRAYPDGTVFRCIPVRDSGRSHPIGSVQGLDLRLAGAAGPCPADRCLCPTEYRNMEDFRPAQRLGPSGSRIDS